MNARSWVESANGHPEFPLENLPYGVFRCEGESPRIGVAIGDSILDLDACARAGVIEEEACRESSLNALMSLGRERWRELRERITGVLKHDAHVRLQHALVERGSVDMLLPADIGDYTDFYASIHHATNVGKLFRPGQPLLPNYQWVPIGYHGRASSIVPSGTGIRRPLGQTRQDDAATPSFGASRRLDYELELGIFAGPGNALGDPIPLAHARDHMFGVCLVNDWSARDIQQWEYQPLGPFLAKSFATTISPWVVTFDALEPFRTKAAPREPAPLAYLAGDDDGAFDIVLEVWLKTPRMTEPVRVSRSNFRDLYWTAAQLVTHHASNGCNLRPGDLLASGTVSGEAPDARGCLLEFGGITLPNGETRRFLEDGDEVILSGYCEREGAARIGFGECRGRVLPAIAGTGGREAS